MNQPEYKRLGYNYYNRDSIWSVNYWDDVQTSRAKRTAALLPDIKSVLDVGCGAGIVTRELEWRFPCVVGLDFAVRPLCQLRELGISAIQADASMLPFRDKAFDAIVATELIEHLPNPLRGVVLHELARVARSHILVTVPYREVLEASYVKCADCGCIFHAWRHAKSFDLPDMESMFEPAFRCTILQELGPFSRKVPRPFVTIAHALDAYMHVERDLVVCPQCGNGVRYTTRQTLLTRLLLGGPVRLLPLRKLPEWIAALYESREDR